MAFQGRRFLASTDRPSATKLLLPLGRHHADIGIMWGRSAASELADTKSSTTSVKKRSMAIPVGSSNA